MNKPISSKAYKAVELTFLYRNLTVIDSHKYAKGSVIKNKTVFIFKL